MAKKIHNPPPPEGAQRPPPPPLPPALERRLKDLESLENIELFAKTVDRLLGNQVRRQKLEAIAHAAWHALDDSCEDERGEITIMRKDYDDLSAALEQLCGEGGDVHDVIGKLPAGESGDS